MMLKMLIAKYFGNLGMKNNGKSNMRIPPVMPIIPLIPTHNNQPPKDRK